MRLTKRQYEVVRRFLAGQTTGQTAKELGLSAPSVSNALRAARERLPGLGEVVEFARALHKSHTQAA